MAAPLLPVYTVQVDGVDVGPTHRQYLPAMKLAVEEKRADPDLVVAVRVNLADPERIVPAEDFCLDDALVA